MEKKDREDEFIKISTLNELDQYIKNIPKEKKKLSTQLTKYTKTLKDCKKDELENIKKLISFITDNQNKPEEEKIHNDLIEKTFILQDENGDNLFHTIYKKDPKIILELPLKEIPDSCYKSHIFLQKNNEGKTPLEIIDYRELPQELLNKKYHDYYSTQEPFFHVAIKLANIDLITRLIENAKVNIYEKDNNGLNALQKVTHIRDEDKLEKILELLKAHHVPYILGHEMASSKTPIIMAISNNNLIAVKKLVQHYSELIPLYNILLLQTTIESIDQNIDSITKEILLFLIDKKDLYTYNLTDSKKHINACISIIETFKSRISIFNTIDKTKLRALAQSDTILLNILNDFLAVESKLELTEYLNQYLLALKNILIRLNDYSQFYGENIFVTAITRQRTAIIKLFIPFLSKNKDSILNYIDTAIKEELFPKEEVRNRLKQKKISLEKTNNIDNTTTLCCSIALLVSASTYIFCSTIKRYESLKPHTIIACIICLSCILTSKLVKHSKRNNLNKYFADNLQAPKTSPKLQCDSVLCLDSSRTQAL